MTGSKVSGRPFAQCWGPAEVFHCLYCPGCDGGKYKRGAGTTSVWISGTLYIAASSRWVSSGGGSGFRGITHWPRIRGSDVIVSHFRVLPGGWGVGDMPLFLLLWEATSTSSSKEKPEVTALCCLCSPWIRFDGFTPPFLLPFPLTLQCPSLCWGCSKIFLLLFKGDPFGFRVWAQEGT